MAEQTKEWWKSKTIWINVLAIIAGVASALSGQMAAGETLTLAGIANIILRIATTTKIQ